MTRLIKLNFALGLLLLFQESLNARDRAQGFCTQGGQLVSTASINSATRVMQSYPSCTVTVYLAGTVTPATLFADDIGTAKANPFTASATGYWFFYADNGRYDVQLSGGGIPTPFTLGDIILNGAIEKLITEARFGAKCDGLSDDRLAIAAALVGGGIVRFPAGTCRVGPPATGGAIVVPSDTTIILDPKTIIKALTGFHDDPGANRMIDLLSVSNVTILGNGGQVQMLKAEYLTGEQRHGILVSQSTNVYISNLRMSDTGGDGYLIQGAIGGGGNACRNVLLEQVVSDNARRNGLAITHCVGCRVLGGEFKNTTGTSPQAGIDIEPNANETIQGVELLGVRTSGNTEAGLKIVPNFLAVAQDRVYSLMVRDYVSYQDGTAAASGMGIFIGLQSGDTATFPVGGQIVIDGAHIFEPFGPGVAIQRWHDKMPRTYLRNVTVTNPNRTGAANYDPGNVGWSGGERAIASNSGFVFGTTAGEPSTTYTGKVEFINCIAQDLRAAVTMNLAFYLHAVGAGKIDSFLLDPQAVNYTLSASNSAVNWNVGRGNVKYTVRPIKSVAIGFSPEPFIGYEFTATAAIAFTLGTAANVEGAEYFFRDTGTGFTVTPNVADTIDIFPLTAGQSITVATTGRGIRNIGLRANGVTKWLITEWVSYYPANGPLYVNAGYGLAPNDPNSILFGSQGVAPNSISAVFGSGAGTKLNFGWHNGAAFVPTSTIYDTGRHDLFQLQVGSGVVIGKIAAGNVVGYDPPSLADGATSVTTVTVTGALATSGCFASTGSIVTGEKWIISTFVGSVNTATVTLTNKTGGTVDLPPGTLSVICLIQ